MKQPCPGLSMFRTQHGAPFLRVHYQSDPTMTPERLAVIRAKYTSQAFFEREMEIRADALSGQRVFDTFDPAVHVIKHHDIPRRLCRYMAIDPHPRTPHAFLWIGIDAWNDWYCYREAWPSQMYGRPGRVRDDQQDNQYTTKQYADAIAKLEGNELDWHDEYTDNEWADYHERRDGERIITRYMDQAGKGFRVSAEGQELETFATRYTKYGISCADPKKSHEAGEDAVRNLLQPRMHSLYGKNWPQLHISDECPELILEMQNIRYKLTRTISDERELKQERAEFRVHEVDNLRYLSTAPLGWHASDAS